MSNDKVCIKFLWNVKMNWCGKLKKTFFSVGSDAVNKIRFYGNVEHISADEKLQLFLSLWP